MSGELGIRTPGPVTVNSFQDCRNRPLCQLSGCKIIAAGLIFQKNYKNRLKTYVKNDLKINHINSFRELRNYKKKYYYSMYKDKIT